MARFSFFSFSELGYGSSEFSSNRVRLFLRSNFVKIIAIKIERTRIHFESDVFALDLMVPNNALLEVLRVTENGIRVQQYAWTSLLDRGRTCTTPFFLGGRNQLDGQGCEKQTHYLCSRPISFMSIKLSFQDPVQRDTNRVILSRTPDKNPNPALGYRLDPIPKLDRGCDEFSGRQTNHDICYVSYSST